MSVNVLHVLDKAMAEDIASRGFSYSKEKIGEQEVYKFVLSIGLVSLICDKYDNKKYYKAKYMNY